MRVKRLEDLTYAPTVWEWMQRNPGANLDDSSPNTLEGFIELVTKRVGEGANYYGVFDNARFVGLIGAQQTAEDEWTLRGVIFDEWFCGKQGTKEAMKEVLWRCRCNGANKVKAFFYSHNKRIARYLKKFGFEAKEVLRDLITQGGKPVDVQTMVLDFLEVQ